MQRHLFLTGPSGVGKTTLIRKVLGPRALGYAGGFVTERALDEDGTLLGFDLYPGAAAADFSLSHSGSSSSSLAAMRFCSARGGRGITAR